MIEPNNISLTSLTNRPNMTCDPNDGAPRTTAQWFNTSCFQRLTLAANAGQIGDEAARRGPRPWLHAHGPVAVQELRR